MRSRSHSQSRCCPCMKNGRCIRCQCVKKGLLCVDCRPSLSNPSRCENSTCLTAEDTPTAERPIHLHPGSIPSPSVSSVRDDCIPDLPICDTHQEPTSGSSRNDRSFAELDCLTRCMSHRRKILKRIPRLSRISAARKLATIVEQVISRNDILSWSRLFQFPKRCLFAPQRGGKRWNLASLVNKQVSQESDIPKQPSGYNVGRGPRLKKTPNPIDTLSARVSSKLEEGDYRGAVRLTCSEDVIADHSDSTLEALRQKHPPQHPDSSIPDLPINDPLPFPIDAALIRKAISSIPNGSGGGPDGLLPQHLKDLTGPTAGDGGVLLLKALTALVALVLEGRTPEAIRPLFFGASLTALRKKSGGIRPIAVGCTIRRLASKCACHHALNSIPQLLSPYQMGFGISGGAEAAVHAGRVYLNHLSSNKAILKVDFENAFNSIRRDKVLLAASKFIPDLLPFAYSAYSTNSILWWDDVRIDSSEGIQQGDPIGPLLFCLTIHDLVLSLNSQFKVFYLDDGTIGGKLEDISADLKRIEDQGRELGLYLNVNKSELISNDQSAVASMLSSFPGLQSVPSEHATLLGSPLGTNAMATVLDSQIQQLKLTGERLHHLQSHDALTILRHSFALPTLLHVLRTSPAFSSPLLPAWDNLLLSIFSSITNIDIHPGDPAWLQATLPVGSGGLGIQSACHLAPSAFLASADGASSLMLELLPVDLSTTPYVERISALAAWRHELPQDTPVPSTPSLQKAWDKPRVDCLFDAILSACGDQESRARLSAASSKESGAWLNAPPISSLGLRMPNDAVRIAVGLRVGAPISQPHVCVHCGKDVDHLARHGLSCKFSQGRISRHNAINNIIHHSLAAANIPSRLEPSGLHRSDGNWPDGITMIPWSQGKYLVWDVTCPDTFCTSNRLRAISEPGGAAAHAETVISSLIIIFISPPLSSIIIITIIKIIIIIGNATSVLGSLPNYDFDFDFD